jgi:hypothetical protein
MTDEELYKLAGVEPTPQIEELVWLVRQKQLIDFWENTSRQVDYQRQALDAFKPKLKEKNT